MHDLINTFQIFQPLPGPRPNTTYIEFSIIHSQKFSNDINCSLSNGHISLSVYILVWIIVTSIIGESKAKMAMRTST